MALALALIALVLVGALVAAICFVGIQEERVGESARRLPRSFGAVEAGIAEVIRGWDPTVYNARQASPFDSAPVPAGYPTAWAAAPYNTGAYGGHVYKLNGELYFIDMVGRDSLPPGPGPVAGARQRVGLLAHVRPVTSGIEAALTTGGPSHLSGLVTVEGQDHVPPGWDPCGPPDSGRAGIRTRSGVIVSASGAARILGDPPIHSTPSPVPVARLEDLTYSQLAAWATHTLPGQTFGHGVGPVVVDGRCDEAVATNWGDGGGPNQLCGNYFPVLHITGDATLGGLQGQGVLLVDGSLVVHDGIRWHGLVIVRGSLTIVADPTSDIAMWGAVLVEDSVVLQATSSGSVTINYSKCAISKALETVAVVAMLRARGWVGLSDVP